MIQGSLEFVKAGMEVSIEAASARTEAVDVLDRTLGAGKGGAEYEKLGQLARDIGIGREQALSEFKRLNAAGFKQDAIPRLIEEMANIDKGRGAGSGQRLEKLLERTQAQGKLDMAGVKNAAKQLGISQDDVIRDLATRLHKTTDQVKVELKKGVDATKGQEAILAAVDKKFGGLAKKGAESIPALLGAIQDQMSGLFDQVNISPLQKTLANIKNILDSSIGKDLKAAVNNLFGSIFTALFGETAKGGDKLKSVFKGVTAFINGMASAVRVIVPLVQAFIGGLLGGLGMLGKGKGGNPFEGLQKDLPKLKQTFSEAGQLVAKFIGLLGAITGKVLEVGVAIVHAFANPEATIKRLGIALLKLPATIVPAVITGLVSLAKGIGEAIPGALESVLTGISGAIGKILSKILGKIKSPLAAIFGGDSGIFGGILEPAKSSLATGALDVGAGIPNGMIEGIMGGQSGVISAVIAVAEAAILAARSKLRTNSPSLVFDEIGGFTAQGLAQGMNRGTHHVIRAGSALGGAAAAAAGGALGVPGLGGPAVPPANQNGSAAAGGPVVIQATIQVKGSGSPQQNQQAGEDIGAQIEAGIRAYFRRRAG
jgi:hypothetical protein